VNIGAVLDRIEVTAYVKTNVWDDFLKFRKSLPAQNMRIIEQTGAKLLRRQLQKASALSSVRADAPLHSFP